MITRQISDVYWQGFVRAKLLWIRVGGGFVCVGIIGELLSFGLRRLFGAVRLCAGCCFILVVCAVGLVLLGFTLLRAVISISIGIFRLILLIWISFMSSSSEVLCWC
jgi:hypothetical protein